MPESTRKRGRPAAPKGAKSRDPNYVQTTLYVERAVYADVRAALIREGGDFSELVNRLLCDWIKKR